jgi:thioredoxin-related protein
MERLFLVFSLIFLANFSFAQEKIEWMKFEDAVAANEKNPKMLLVDVYTDWCGWCKKMDKETFTNPKVIKYVNSQFYPVKLNAEDTKRTFNFMGKEYNESQIAAAMRVRSYPNFVVIEPKLQNLAQLPGYRQPDQFIAGLDELIQKAFRQKP